MGDDMAQVGSNFVLTFDKKLTYEVRRKKNY